MVFRGEIWPIVEVLSTQNSVRRCGLPMNEMMMLMLIMKVTVNIRNYDDENYDCDRNCDDCDIYIVF